MSQDDHETRRRSRAGIAVASAGLGGVLLLGPLFGTFALAKDLTPDAQQAIKDVPGATVTFTGREATITGALDDHARASAIAAVQAVSGVRWATAVQQADRATGSSDDTDAVQSAAPTAEPLEREASDGVSLKDLVVLFEPDSAAVTPAGATVLDRVAASLEKAPDARLELTGHSAVATFPEAQEIAFSRTRAQAAADYLVAKGIDPERLTVSGAGVSAPAGADPAANRRVTFTELKGTN